MKEHYGFQSAGSILVDGQPDIFSIVQGPLTTIPIGIVLFSTFEFALYLISVILASHFLIKRNIFRVVSTGASSTLSSSIPNFSPVNPASVSPAPVASSTLKILESRINYLRNNYLIMAILLSSFGYTGYILMMIWDYPTSFVWLVTAFTLSSNTIALKVFFETTALRAFMVVGISFFIRKFLLFALSFFDHNLSLFI